MAYYSQIVTELGSGSYPVADLAITRKIAANEQSLSHLGDHGDVVTYWFGCDRTNRKPKAIKINSLPYWADHYIAILDEVLKSVGVNHDREQLTLFNSHLSPHG